MTIEASLIIPLVIGSFLLLIFTAFYLYNKCVLTVDTYIKCYRASIFTYWEEGYGEVSYGVLANREASEARKYIESRSDYTRYPFFDLHNEDIVAMQFGLLLPEIIVQIKLEGTAKTFVGRDYKVNITITSSITNPVSNIRSARRNEANAGN
jgi:hypothetical protein